MKTAGFKHPYRMIAWGLAIASILVVVLHLLLPYMVNTSKMRQSIAARGAMALSGRIDFRKIKPALLPWPRVTVDQFSLTQDDRVTLQIPEMVIYPEFWPLFGGNLRIKRFEMIKPQMVHHDFTPAVPTPDAESKRLPADVKETASHILAFVDNLLGHIDAKIVNGHLEIWGSGRKLADLSQFNCRISSTAKQFSVNMGAIVKQTGKIQLETAVDRHTFNGTGHMTLDGLEPHWLSTMGLLPPWDHLSGMVVNLNLKLETQAMQRFTSQFTASVPAIHLDNDHGKVTIEDVEITGETLLDPQKWDVAISKFQTASPPMRWSGSVQWPKAPQPSAMPIEISMQGSALEIAAIRSAALQLWGDNSVVHRVFDIVQGGRIPEWTLNLSAPAWNHPKLLDHLRAQCRLEKGRIHIPNDLIELDQVSGQIAIASGALKAHTVSARYGNTSATDGTLALGLYDGSRTFTLDTLIEADPAQIPGTLKKLIRHQQVLAQLDAMPTFDGRITGRLILGDKWDKISAQIEGGAKLAYKDTQLDISGTVQGLATAEPWANLLIKGRMGSETAQWIYLLTGVPSNQGLNTPFNISDTQVTLGAKGQISLDGAFDWTDGPLVKAVLSSTGSDFHLKQLHIKDDSSDAQISYRRRKSGRIVEAGFKGVVHGSTVEKMMIGNRFPSGRLEGKLMAHINRAAMEKSTLVGKLSARGLTIPIQGPFKPIEVARASFNGRGKTFELSQGRLRWNDSAISLAGRGQFHRQAIDLKIDLQADQWDAYQFTTALEKDPASSDTPPSDEKGASIPIHSRVSAAIGQLTYDRYRFAPMKAIIAYDGRKTLITITEADLCGVQFPGSIELNKGTAKMEFHPQASRSTLKDTGSCLLDNQHTEKLEGTVELNGTLTTHGQTRNDFLTHLKGRMNLSIDEGRIYNVGSAGLFTNLLSYLSVNQYIKGGLPDLSQDVFNYDRFDTRWVFDGGHVFIEEGILKSNSVNMVADGRYHLLSKNIDLVVLVSPLTTVDWIVERIPILGNILQGTLVAIPVSVKGPESDPKVLPMAPSAVGARLGGILKRTLKTPVRIIEPLIKDGNDKKSSGN